MNTTTDRELRSDDERQMAAALQALPQLQPSDELMQRIGNIAPAAGRAPRRNGLWGSALLAASLGFVALMIWTPSKYRQGNGLPVAAVQSQDGASRLPALIAQSAYLEAVLSSLPDEGRVQRVSTASTITALEDRVAMIDAQLNQPQIKADNAGSEMLWRQRVGLMDTLVALRATPREPLWL